MDRNSFVLQGKILWKRKRYQKSLPYDTEFKFFKHFKILTYHFTLWQA
jgi:hypothetical protein